MTILCGLDIETTGLDVTKGHRIVEIAASFYRAETGQKVGEWVQRINPERAIDAAAQEVHGISFEALSGCPTWEVVAPKVNALLTKADYVVAHNGVGFDAPFVAHELNRVGLDVPGVLATGVIDTMLGGRWATPLGKLPSLKELCFACSVEYDKSKAHGASYDTDIMMQCFFKGQSYGFFPLPTKEQCGQTLPESGSNSTSAES